MANHFWPGRENRSPIEYLIDNGLHRYASAAIEIVEGVDRIWIPEVQVKSGNMRNACFYGCPTNDFETRILNFTIRPSELNVEFRYPHYLPLNIYDALQWQNVSTTKYAKFTAWGHNELVKIISEYVDKLWRDHEKKLLKVGGQSALERDLKNRLIEIYPDEDISWNIRPDSMRSSKNRPLELDLFLKKRRLAIEVQGHRHYEDSRLQENDQLKIKWCKENNIKLLWIKWQKAKDELLRMQGEDIEKELKQLIESLITSDSYFYHYQ